MCIVLYSFYLFWAEVQKVEGSLLSFDYNYPHKNDDRPSDTLATGTQTCTVLTRVASTLRTVCDRRGTVRWQGLKTTELTGVNNRLSLYTTECTENKQKLA
jgi:hypothetical protein